MHGTKETTGTLNSLLRGELAATETYQQALDVLESAPGPWTCGASMRNTVRPPTRCGCQIHEIGGEPDHSSGAWGAWAGAVEGAAKAFGPRTAAQALMRGEEFGVKDYERALQNDHVPTECKTLIHNQLLPHTREHVATLERILDLL